MPYYTFLFQTTEHHKVIYRPTRYRNISKCGSKIQAMDMRILVNTVKYHIKDLQNDRNVQNAENIRPPTFNIVTQNKKETTKIIQKV
jgi:hypothetical protein